MKLDESNDLTFYRENAWNEYWPVSPISANDTGFKDYVMADYTPYLPSYLTYYFESQFAHSVPYSSISVVYRRHQAIIWTAVAAYLAMVFLGPKFMRDRKPFGLKRSLTVWNLLLAVFSFCGTVRLIPHLFYGQMVNPPMYLVCRNIGGHSIDDIPYFWGTLFLWSKIAEFIDTAFLVLRKKPVIFLHWFHHVTVSLYCWYSWANESNTSIYFCTMNYLVHAIMYFYYFLGSIGKAPNWGLFVTVIQVAQMMLGIFVNTFQYYASTQVKNCDVSWSMLIAATVMYAIYLSLFMQFFAKKYLVRKPQRSTTPVTVSKELNKISQQTEVTDDQHNRKTDD